MAIHSNSFQHYHLGPRHDLANEYRVLSVEFLRALLLQKVQTEKYAHTQALLLSVAFDLSKRWLLGRERTQRNDFRVSLANAWRVCPPFQTAKRGRNAVWAAALAPLPPHIHLVMRLIHCKGSEANLLRDRSARLLRLKNEGGGYST